MTTKGLPDRWLAIVAAVSMLWGLVMAASMMRAAWEHNPQGEFYETAADGTTIVHWIAWLPIGVGWFFAGAAAVFCVLGLVVRIGYGFLRKEEPAVANPRPRR